MAGAHTVTLFFSRFYCYCFCESNHLMATTAKNRQPSAPAGYFATTHWTVILTAGQTRSPEAHEALETLCRTYWYPLYTFICRQGHGPHDAKALTQAVCARFLAQSFLGDVTPRRGK